MKKNYFKGKEQRADIFGKSAGSGGLMGLKNKTTDTIFSQLQKVKMNSSEGERVSSVNKEQILSEDAAGKLNIEDLIFVEKRLNAVCLKMEQDFDIYDEVKEYVDIVQEESFSEFFSSIKNSRIKMAIKNSMILERWAMFFVFFFYFNQDSAKTALIYLKELIQLAHKNILSYLGLFATWISSYENLEVKSA